LAWNAQAVAGSYERARGLRAVGEHPDGFRVTATKTVAVPVDRLYDAFVDESLRERWLPEGGLRERTASKPKSARFDWGDSGTRVNVTFIAKGEAKSTAALQHERLADAEEADRMKSHWRAHRTRLSRTSTPRWRSRERPQRLRSGQVHYPQRSELDDDQHVAG
jgi:hypothetical protein